MPREGSNDHAPLDVAAQPMRSDLMRDQRIEPSDGAAEPLQHRDRGTAARSRWIEREQRVARLVVHREVGAQHGEIAARVDARVGQQRAQVQRVGAGTGGTNIEPGQPVHVARMQHDGVRDGPGQELDREAPRRRVDQLVRTGDDDEVGVGRDRGGAIGRDRGGRIDRDRGGVGRNRGEVGQDRGRGQWGCQWGCGLGGRRDRRFRGRGRHRQIR